MVLEQLNQIFRKVLKDPGIVLKPETTAKDVPAWDSLNHVALILAIERHFGVSFAISEVVALKNVGDLAAAVDAKLKAKKS